MKEPGLDDRHHDKNGKIQQKHSDTQNQNLPSPIPGFSPGTQRSRPSEKTQVRQARKAIQTRKQERHTKFSQAQEIG